MIRDREMVLDCLESCKIDSVRFTEAANESSDPNLRQTLKQLRDQVENSHQEVFQIASQHGWYQNPSPANPQEVQRIRNHFAGGTTQQMQGQYGGYGSQYGTGGYAGSGGYAGTQQQYGGYGGGYSGGYGSSQSALRQPTAQPGQSGQTYSGQYPTTSYGQTSYGQTQGSGSYGYGQTQGWSPASPGGATYGTSGMGTGRRY